MRISDWSSDVCSSDLLTPTNFGLKTTSTYGSAAVAAVAVDDSGLYVQQGGYGILELTYAAGVIAGTADYGSLDLTLLVPEHGDPGFTHLAVQRQPGRSEGRRGGKAGGSTCRFRRCQRH